MNYPLLVAAIFWALLVGLAVCVFRSCRGDRDNKEGSGDIENPSAKEDLDKKEDSGPKGKPSANPSGLREDRDKQEESGPYGKHSARPSRLREDREKKEELGPSRKPSVKPSGLRARDRKKISPNDEDRFSIFDFETLKNATRNFHKHNKLGEGGFGPVYLGTLENGKKIAVKKLSVESKQGKREFLNEVKLEAKLQHRNLVQILGGCEEGPDLLLVYEYVPNKSLDKLLFDPHSGKQPEWKLRLKIILGIARGLLYLHEDCRDRIIHRDIKASNILLDQQMNPKIADFGLARLFADDKSHVSTDPAGTRGYIAPEYAMERKLSMKADVYSFGVLILEIICGRKNVDLELSPENQILMKLVWRSFKKKGGSAVDVIDTKIVEKGEKEEAMRCIHVALLCTQNDESRRPSISEVSQMLSFPAMELPPPTKPPLY